MPRDRSPAARLPRGFAPQRRGTYLAVVPWLPGRFLGLATKSAPLIQHAKLSPVDWTSVTVLGDGLAGTLRDYTSYWLQRDKFYLTTTVV